MAVNVLQLVGSFNQGGSELQAVQLIGQLHKDGNYTIFPACLNIEGVLRTEIERFGFTDLPEFPLNSFYDLNMARQLRRCIGYMREHRIAIVQTHDFYTNVFGMLAGAMARVPVRIAAKRETGTRTAGQAFFERRAYDLAHTVVANAEAVRDHLITTGVAAHRIKVIHNGLDPERLRVSDERTREMMLADIGLPVEAGRRFVTIVANLRSEVKNHRMFLRSASLIAEKIPGAAFVIAGEGDLTAPLEELAGELKIADDVHFVGRCGRIPELLAVSEVCVLCSRTEGFSNALLEYMAAAKPVVATDVGGAREVVVEGKTGFLVASDDEAALADRVIELLDRPEMAREFGVRGKETIVERFSLSAQLGRTLELYDRLLKNG